MEERFAPNDVVPKSANYKIYDNDGHDGGRIHLEKGTRFPMARRFNCFYEKETPDEN